MENPSKIKAGSILKLLLKITVTIICFWYISQKINFQEMILAIQQAKAGWIALAVFCFMMGKLIFASIRLNIYFKNIGLQLTFLQNAKLYWLGMFYNLFLPGSISGDAYKVILLSKNKYASYKKLTAAVLLDRISGLLALGLFLSLFAIFVINNPTYDIMIAAFAVLSVVTLYIVVRFFLKDFLTGFFPTFLWGIIVQLMMIFTLYSIMLALNLSLLQSEWIFIFLVASVISVLPISLGGGLGTRELIFLEGAKYFNLDIHIAIVISLLFYLTNVFSSLGGLYFVFNNPLKNNNT